MKKKKSCAHVQSTHSAVIASGGTEELECPASFKSPVWGKEVSGKNRDVAAGAQESQMTVETHQAWPRI